MGTAVITAFPPPKLLGKKKGVGELAPSDLSPTAKALGRSSQGVSG